MRTDEHGTHNVFGTIAAESQRMINVTYSAFVQGFMPMLTRPDVGVRRRDASCTTTCLEG